MNDLEEMRASFRRARLSIEETIELKKKKHEDATFAKGMAAGFAVAAAMITSYLEDEE